MNKRVVLPILAGALIFTLSHFIWKYEIRYDRFRIQWPLPAEAAMYDPSTTRSGGIRSFTILFGTKLFNSVHPWFKTTRAIKCGPSLECSITSDKRLFNSSDVVVFHMWGTDCFAYAKETAALPRPPNQRWVLFNRESPSNTNSLHYLNGLINWTMTYMRESDLRYTYYDVKPGVFRGGFNPNRDYLVGKTEMAAILVSNCVQSRLRWVRKLQQYIDVHVYGDCGPFHCSKVNLTECMIKLQKHKFYLSFENSYCQDYVTEKLYQNALENGIVPVVLSGANFSDPSVIPPGSFINAQDFPSVKDLAEYMKKVGGNRTLYSNYFRWHSNYTIVLATDDVKWCDVCKKLDTDRKTKVYNNIEYWYSTQRLCKQYPIPH